MSAHGLAGVALDIGNDVVAFTGDSLSAGGAGGGIAISTTAEGALWSAVLLGVLAVAVVRGRRRGLAALLGVASVAAAVVGGLPLHAVGAAALLAVVVGARAQAFVPAALGGLAVVASLPDVVASTLARLDAVVVAAFLHWVGLDARLDGTTVALGPDALLVDPACAAVEGLAVAFVASVVVRTLLRQSLAGTLAWALAHVVVFGFGNLARIAAVGLALSQAPDAAAIVHAVGGPLLALVVHGAFLIGPLVALARCVRVADSSRMRWVPV